MTATPTDRWRFGIYVAFAISAALWAGAFLAIRGLL